MIEVRQVRWDAANEGENTHLFNLIGKVIVDITQKENMVSPLRRNIKALTRIKLIYEHINETNGCMPVAAEANDGACEAKYQWVWNWTRPGSEGPETLHRNYLSLPTGSAKCGSWGSVSTYTHTILDKIWWRASPIIKRRRERHIESIPGTCSISPDVDQPGKQIC